MPKVRYNSGYLTTAYKDIVFAEAPCELKWMWITNRGSGAAKVEIAHVPAGQAAGETMDLVHDFSLAADNYVTNEILIYLEAGDRIAAKSDSADSIVLTFYGTKEYRGEDFNMPMKKEMPRPIQKSAKGYSGSPGVIGGK
tara:strand:+ start:501 stop:920 length:420 start_codon:yes stop_codon:yes gene_type:complete